MDHGVSPTPPQFLASRPRRLVERECAYCGASVQTWPGAPVPDTCQFCGAPFQARRVAIVPPPGPPASLPNPLPGSPVDDGVNWGVLLFSVFQVVIYAWFFYRALDYFANR